MKLLFLNASVILVWLLTAQISIAADIEVNGLFKHTAIVNFKGKQKILKVGKKYVHGLTLIKADTKHAIIEYKGTRKEYGISKKISGSYKAPEAKKQMRISAGASDHYFYRGKINGKPAEFLVDTGASAVALNANDARRLGITRKQSLGDVMVNTANSQVRAYRVNLARVTLGTISLTNIEAYVMPNAHPKQVLLGNSFLSKLNMQIENGVLVLTSKI